MLFETSIRVSPEREAYLQPFLPLVRFILPYEGSLPEYYEYLRNLLVEFACFCDARNVNQAAAIKAGSGLTKWNEKGGISFLYIDGQYSKNCRLTFSDGTDQCPIGLNNYEPWKGIVFSDHQEADVRRANTVKIFLVSDAFEKFLRRRNIPFERQNYEG
jgi:hypothetical protein